MKTINENQITIAGNILTLKHPDGTYSEIILDELPRVHKEPAKEYEHHTISVNGVSFDIVLLPGDTYIMGSPDTSPNYYPDEKQKTVTVKPFAVMETPVTQELYEAVMGVNPSTFKGPTRPVETVNFYEVEAFARKLSELTGIEFYVPSEAEWEYACRGGTDTEYYWGDEPDSDYAVYEATETAPVKSKLPNLFGLYDMAGNVWEWTRDPYNR